MRSRTEVHGTTAMVAHGAPNWATLIEIMEIATGGALHSRELNIIRRVEKVFLSRFSHIASLLLHFALVLLSAAT